MSHARSHVVSPLGVSDTLSPNKPFNFQLNMNMLDMDDKGDDSVPSFAPITETRHESSNSIDLNLIRNSINATGIIPNEPIVAFPRLTKSRPVDEFVKKMTSLTTFPSTIRPYEHKREKENVRTSVYCDISNNYIYKTYEVPITNASDRWINWWETRFLREVMMQMNARQFHTKCKFRVPMISDVKKEMYTDTKFSETELYAYYTIRMERALKNSLDKLYSNDGDDGIDNETLNAIKKRVKKIQTCLAEKKIHHNDIADRNLFYDDATDQIWLIDWGEAKDEQTQFPEYGAHLDYRSSSKGKSTTRKRRHRIKKMRFSKSIKRKSSKGSNRSSKGSNRSSKGSNRSSKGSNRSSKGSNRSRSRRSP